MKLKELCLNLALCDKEGEIKYFLKKEGFWDDTNAWRCYGDSENNFAVFGNQKSRAEDALTEKIINSVDAVLMAECLRKNIDPEGADAPQNINDALWKYFGIRDGKLSNKLHKERAILAENICVVATGCKSNPCYSIIDKGEGQTPEKMPDTLLSLTKSNKLRIPFVQGKFNMGGSGALQFCGKHKLQLVISKRHAEIAHIENGNFPNEWGFTIVRREDPSKGTRNPVYTYLAPNNRILSFIDDELPLLPGEYPNPYQKGLQWGTFIKLYEYQMPGGLKTNINFDLYYRMSLLIPAIALPVRFYERRKGYKGHTQETTLSGLTVRLEEDKRDNLEEGFQIPPTSALSVKGKKMKVSIFAFKRGQSEKYSKNEGIIFVINGQTHGHLSKTFFTRGRVGMDYLKDSLLIIVDCSAFDGRARWDLFMNSRDRLYDCDLKRNIEKELEDLIRNHEGLRELKTRRRQEDIENKLEDSKPLVEVIENILKKSPTLSKLFIQGVRLANPFKIKKAKKQKEFFGKEFPTFFKLAKEYPEDKPKECPRNVKFRITYKTDANNDYLDRDRDPGSFTLSINGEQIRDFWVNIWNGNANLNVMLPEDIKVGEILKFRSKVEDVSRVDPFADDFFVKVTKRVKKNSRGKSGSRKQPPSNEEGEDTERSSYLDLPNIREVKREQWEKFGFNGESALDVKDSGESGYDFYINIENVHLLTEQKANTNIDSKLLEARYKYGMVLIGLALLKDHQSANNQNKESSDSEIDINKKINYVTRVISPILLPLIAGLGDLDIKNTKKTYEEN
jgi:hypothetical protein